MTDEQRLIADAAADFLGRRAGRQTLRAAVEAGTGHDGALWAELAALGWCGLLVPEAAGGLGMGLRELVVLEEVLGAHLAPLPYLETAVLAAAVIGHPGLQGRAWQQRLAADAPVMALSFDAGTADPVAGGWQLEGLWPAVAAAPAAAALLLPARTPGGTALFVVDAGQPGLAVTRRPSIDLTQCLGDVRASAVRLPAEACLGVGAAAEAALAQARSLGALALAAEQLGLASAALAASVAYTGQRVQFGRPVAAFQAVKHRCAQMMVAVECARSAVHGTAGRVDAALREQACAPSPAGLQALVAQACVLADEAARSCARENLQLHGGAGYTWEFDAHLLLRRAQAASQRFGAPGSWLEPVAATLLDLAPPGRPDGGRAGAGSGRDGRDGVGSQPGDEDAIRRGIRAWLQHRLGGEFAALEGLKGPGEPGFDPALARRWERALAEGGWTAVGWPREHGGRGWSLAQQVAFHEEYAKAGGPGRLGHIGEQLLAPTLVRHGTPAQQARFLPPIREGREFWAQGYSEPGAGSDLAAVATRARLDGGQWIVDGQKVWTSWAHLSDWIFVLARTEPGSQRHQGLTLLLVPLRQPGIAVRPIRQITGHAEFNEVFFDGARTEGSLHLGPVGQGWRVAMDLLQVERGVSTLGQQAHFRQELDAVAAVARRNGASRDPVLRQRLARAALGLQALRDNALRVLAGDAGGGDRAGFVAKYAWSNWRRDLGELAMDVLGPAGVVDASDAQAAQLQRLWLESRADTIYAGTNEIQLNLIAERALGMPR